MAKNFKDSQGGKRQQPSKEIPLSSQQISQQKPYKLGESGMNY